MGEFGKRWPTPRLLGRAFDVLAHLDQITIGAINGYAVGGGWSFVLAFDFAIAVEGAEFWVPEVDLDVPYRGAPARRARRAARTMARRRKRFFCAGITRPRSCSRWARSIASSNPVS